jgi:hypothetical protein
LIFQQVTDTVGYVRFGAKHPWLRNWHPTCVCCFAKSREGESMKTLTVVVLMSLLTEIVQIAPARGEWAKETTKRTLAESRASEGRQSMKKFTLVLLMFLAGAAVQMPQARSNQFKVNEAKIAQYKKWLDTMGPQGTQFWVRLDSAKRPHRLYLGENFYGADFQSQERFIDTFSNYLAGHPEKFMLIDLFDARTNDPVGEYGFGGFKLYSKPVASR